MRNVFKSILLLTTCLFSSPPIAASASAIGTVSLTRETFNPAASETVDLTVTFRKAGRASVRVVDRDGFVVRTIAAARPVQRNDTFRWDGHDSGGRGRADQC